MTPLSSRLDLFRPLYQDADPIHDFDHVLRVLRVGEWLARAEGADVETVRLAALLHDVPSAAHPRDTHEEGAARVAEDMLAVYHQPPALIQAVAHCIRHHRFRRASPQPRSREAACLYDADKLECLGAIGIARTFGFAGLHGHPLWDGASCHPTDTPSAAALWPDTPAREWQIKLRQLADQMCTSAGRRLARKRHRVMADFFVQMYQEWSLSDIAEEWEHTA